MVNKKRFKKLAVFILAVLLVSGLAACTIKDGKDNEISSTQPETTSNTVRITFPEGSSIAQIALLLEENGVCYATEFMAAANDPMSLEGYSFEIFNADERAFLLEGYVFPDTYDFYLNEGAPSALKRFLKNMESKLTEEVYLRSAELGYTVDEILTIASIIQEEAGNSAEMGKVSSVIHNRLNCDDFPKLQCDVATFYLRDYVKPYTDSERYEVLLDLYNTYNCEGLPAGPITNCGMHAINAALYPEETDYYYFVTDSKNNYYYAETWEEHRKNCDIAGL